MKASRTHTKGCFSIGFRYKCFCIVDRIHVGQIEKAQYLQGSLLSLYGCSTQGRVRIVKRPLLHRG